MTNHGTNRGDRRSEVTKEPLHVPSPYHLLRPRAGTGGERHERRREVVGRRSLTPRSLLTSVSRVLHSRLPPPAGYARPPARRGGGKRRERSEVTAHRRLFSFAVSSPLHPSFHFPFTSFPPLTLRSLRRYEWRSERDERKVRQVNDDMR